MILTLYTMTAAYLPDGFFSFLDDNENLGRLNEMCFVIKEICPADSKKLVAVMEYTEAHTALEITGIAMCIDKFDFIEGVQNAEQYGKSLVYAKGLEEDWDFKDFIDFKGYGNAKMIDEDCGFTSLGFVQYNDSLQEIMEYDGDDFDHNVSLPYDYGKQHLKSLNVDISDEAFRFFDFNDYGEAVLRKDGVMLTGYGTIKRNDNEFLQEHIPRSKKE